MYSSVSIIGAGPAGYALAADIQSQGREVLLYSHPTHLRHANDVKLRGEYLTADGALDGLASLRVTSDMGEAVAFSEIIILTVPSTGQETVLQELRGFDLRRHIIIAIPGNLFSLIAADLDVGCILETNLSPYSCRMERGGLTVLGRKKLVYIAALQRTSSPPTTTTNNNNNLTPESVYATVQSLFPTTGLHWCTNILEVCLSNVNGVFHPLMMLMNAGRIESTAGDFFLYADGLTRSVANAMLAVDRVRVQIGAALGLRLQSAVQVSNACYGQAFEDLVDLGRNSPPHNKLRAPKGMENRNVSEDVPDLLVCWCALAEKLGVDAAPIRAVIVLAEMATGVDYMKTGRNLQRLRLDGVSVDELLARFSPGPAGELIVSRL